MSDVLFIGVIVGFFALAGLYVQACVRIVGADQAMAELSTDVDPEAEVAA